MKTFTDFAEADRVTPLDVLKTYARFVEFEPAWAFDPDGEDIAVGRRVLKFQSIQEMGHHADRLCFKWQRQPQPCQVRLFLEQFPSRTFDDCVFAHWALHADRTLGPGHCAAALSVEPEEFPDDGADIQYWATWHLTKHPWDGPARGVAEAVARSARVTWVSQPARALLDAYIAANHGALEAFAALPPTDVHPINAQR